MDQLLQLFVFIPLVGFLVSFIFSSKQEKWLSGCTFFIVGMQFIFLFAFTAYWIMNNSPVIDYKHFVFFKEDNIEIFLDFYFDKTTAVFGLLGAFITFLVGIFSKYYLHRDHGYKRFFNMLTLFFFGYNVAIFAGNFETLFIGWEFLGITSFLLIAFYRDRYLPVKNALKTISYYRLGDICLILALWMNHHVWHENITFIKLANINFVAAHIHEHYYAILFIISMIIISAAIKSAQFPFTSWLPRAMEGPTTSSAVFYGSLSVHLGVFLLLRTYPFWESILTMKLFVILIGSLTAIIANSIASVQSSVKTQIAYASAAQIGLMFIEVALGWHVFALIHLVGNAFLRTYQLLVSPSVLGYMIHDQFFNYQPKIFKANSSWITKLSNSFYVLSIKEWNMDTMMKKIIWDPLKYIGGKLLFLSSKSAILFLFFLLLVGFGIFSFGDYLPAQIDRKLHFIFSAIATLLIVRAFVEKRNPLKAWILIILSQLFSILSVALANDAYGYHEILLYASGLTFAAITGIVSIQKLQRLEPQVDLNNFYGHVALHPKLAAWFLIACLAFISLPFTPSFIGMDLLFSNIEKDEYLLITFTTINFLVLELTVLRIYARLFLGPSKRQTHPIAYRSS